MSHPEMDQALNTLDKCFTTEVDLQCSVYFEAGSRQVLNFWLELGISLASIFPSVATSALHHQAQAHLLLDLFLVGPADSAIGSYVN